MRRKLVSQIPILLIVFRGISGLIVIGISLFRLDSSGVILSSLIGLGVLSDVFDGIIARKLGISTEELRIWDSRIDVIFFVSLIISLLIRNSSLFLPVGVFFFGLMIMEMSVHLISFLKFKKQSSTHHYLSKIFAIFLFGLIIQFFLYPEVTIYFWIVVGIAVLSFSEAGLIMLRLNKWECDIRTVFDIENGEVKKKSSRTMIST